MTVNDIYVDGIKAGWNIINASRLEDDITVDADIAIIGTGAGGGTSAEILAKAGIRVVMVEHGPLKSSNDFNLQERDAYPSLYQESAARISKTGHITVLQGRAVGGSTTINWTSSFRTPEQTLRHWSENFDIKDFSPEAMAPWFQRMEERLGIAPWKMAPNANNTVLRQGCEKLGYSWDTISRNVRNCWNLGYCGTGCPTNAKQGMLVTTIPEALKNDAQLIFFCRADKLLFKNDKVTALKCTAMLPNASQSTGRTVTIHATHFIMAGGAINSPALLMHSNTPDPHALLGKRTFIHPVVASMAYFNKDIDAFNGAPQSIYSDQFQWAGGIEGPAGYKLEALPLHPAMTATLLGEKNAKLSAYMSQFPQTNCLLALLRDGFHPDSSGGSISLRSDGSGTLNYDISDFIWEGARRSLETQAKIQFAAGAKAVLPLHQEAHPVYSPKAAREMIYSLKMEPFLAKVGTAHLMGGCPMSENPKKGIVNSLGRHHYLTNISVIDGSVFPTSIGANPQLSIYGLAAKFSEHIASSWPNLLPLQ